MLTLISTDPATNAQRLAVLLELRRTFSGGYLCVGLNTVKHTTSLDPEACRHLTDYIQQEIDVGEYIPPGSRTMAVYLFRHGLISAVFSPVMPLARGAWIDKMIHDLEAACTP